MDVSWDFPGKVQGFILYDSSDKPDLVVNPFICNCRIFPLGRPGLDHPFVYDCRRFPGFFWIFYSWILSGFPWIFSCVFQAFMSRTIPRWAFLDNCRNFPGIFLGLSRALYCAIPVTSRIWSTPSFATVGFFSLGKPGLDHPLTDDCRSFPRIFWIFYSWIFLDFSWIFCWIFQACMSCTVPRWVVFARFSDITLTPCAKTILH